MEEPKKLKPKLELKKLSTLEKWESEGVKCHYVRFHQPVARFKNDEPVGEFYSRSTNTKYCVDSIVYSEHGIIWRARDEFNIAPLAAAIVARSVV